MLNIFQKMAELSFFMFTKTTLLYYGPDLLAQLTAFLLWLSPLPKGKKSKMHMYYTKHLFSSAGQLILYVMAEHWAWRAGSFIPDGGAWWVLPFVCWSFNYCEDGVELMFFLLFLWQTFYRLAVTALIKRFVVYAINFTVMFFKNNIIFLYFLRER